MNPTPEGKAPEKDPRPVAPVTVTSEQVLQGAREIWISHANEVYRLRVTRQGKLLLSK